MKSFFSRSSVLPLGLGLGLLLSQTALAELTYTVISATKDGKPLDPSEIQLTPYTPAGTGGIGYLPHVFNDSSSGTNTPFAPINKPATPPVRPSRGGGGGSSSSSRKRSTMQQQQQQKQNQARSNPININSGWCGAVYTTPTSDNPVTEAHGYFQVPTPTARPNVTVFPQYASAWVGIDGASWNTAVLQSGVGTAIDADGAIANWVWWEWFPAGAVTISSMTANSGDFFEVTITASDSEDGTITIANVNQDIEYRLAVSGGGALGRYNAEWIIEDPSGGDYSSIPFAWFPDLWFEETYALTANGSTYGIDDSVLDWVTDMCESAEYDNDDMYGFSVTSTSS